MQSKHCWVEKYSNQIDQSYPAVVRECENQKLFSILVKLGLNVCVRCGEPIAECEDCWIEHIVPHGIYEGEEQERLFFDLDNIGFSHARHNTSAGGSLSRSEGDFINVESLASGKYRSTVNYKNNQIKIGTFDSEVEAAENVDLCHIKYFNERHNLNFGEKMDLYLRKIDSGWNNETFERKIKLIDSNSDISLSRGFGTSRFRGVTKVKNSDSWQMRFTIGDKVICKRFKNEEDAAKAYDDLCMEHRSGKGGLNFPERFLNENIHS